MVELPTILVIGTLDTKLEELSYLRDEILSGQRCNVKLLDVSRDAKSSYPGISENDMISFERGDMRHLDRGKYIHEILQTVIPLVKTMISQSLLHGIISAGGSSGTSLATAIMRNAVPVGIPKLMVSTIASGDVRPLVEETDITLMYSVVDIAGMNTILRNILSNAAGAIVGMTLAYQKSIEARSAVSENNTRNAKKSIAITMFGVTTPCVDQIRQLLSPEKYEVFVFHATGAGGRAMERLIQEGQIDAVIDLTTTEIADQLFGGNMAAGPDRLKAAAEAGIPQVISLGACDMVNFGPKDTVPDKYQDRHLFEHNPAVTLMRTNVAECRDIGDHIANVIRHNATRPENIEILIPSKGVSMLDAPDQAFWDEGADAVLFDTIDHALKSTDIRVNRLDHNINDSGFSEACARNILQMMQQ
ncbi:MAG: hypothetical protein Q9160_007418 [Pyrenula sp. 1 TL-2023]